MITNRPLRKKSCKGETRLEILISVVALAETRVQVVQVVPLQNRTSVFIKIQVQVIVRITFRIQIEFRIGQFTVVESTYILGHNVFSICLRSENAASRAE